MPLTFEAGRRPAPSGRHHPGVNALPLPLPDGGPGPLSADEDGEIAYGDTGSRRCLTELGGGTGAVLTLPYPAQTLAFTDPHRSRRSRGADREHRHLAA